MIDNLTDIFWFPLLRCEDFPLDSLLQRKVIVCFSAFGSSDAVPGHPLPRHHQLSVSPRRRRESVNWRVPRRLRSPWETVTRQRLVSGCNFLQLGMNRCVQQRKSVMIRTCHAAPFSGHDPQLRISSVTCSSVNRCEYLSLREKVKLSIGTFPPDRQQNQM